MMPGEFVGGFGWEGLYPERSEVQGGEPGWRARAGKGPLSQPLANQISPALQRSHTSPQYRRSLRSGVKKGTPDGQPGCIRLG